MSRADISIRQYSGYSCVPTYRWQVASGAAASIKAGEPVKANAAGGQYATLLVDDDLTIGTDQPFIGVAMNDSTDTASADGVVDVYIPFYGLIYAAGVTTAANFDARSEIDAIRGEYLTMDLVSSKFTIDENVGSGANNAFLIIDGDISVTGSTASPLALFGVRSDATALGRGSA